MARRKDYKKMIVEKDNGGRLERFVFNVMGVNRGDDSTNGDNPNYLVLLNSNNSGIVEPKIENDPNYITFTKYLVERFKSENGNSFPFNEEKKVLAVVRMIDVENSTNVWRFNREGLNSMVKYIVDNHTTFLTNLLNTDDNIRCQLVEDLIAAVNPAGQDTEKTEPRSLASKVCKYLAQYLSDPENDDNYYINDSFVRKTLPYYCAYYGVEIGERKDCATNYKHLFEVLDDIREKAASRHDLGEKLTRGHMDHIMWYCYKNSGNDDEFTRIRFNVPKKEDVNKLLQAFINLYGVIDVAEAFNLINSKYQDYQQEAFNVDLEKPLIKDSRYYKKEGNRISIFALTNEAIESLFSIQSDSGFDYWFDQNAKLTKYKKETYQKTESLQIAKKIVGYASCRDFNVDEIAESIRKALFEDFIESEELASHIANLVDNRLSEEQVVKVLKNRKIRLPVLKGNLYSDFD